MRALLRVLIASPLVVALVAGCSRDEQAPVQAVVSTQAISDAVAGSELAVAATVAKVEPFMGTNRYGDRLIYSRTTLRVDETLKGAPARELVVDVEGGTLGGLRLEVSDIPKMEVGKRAVFLLRHDGSALVPHHRGDGILPLDAQDRVQGAPVDLEGLRRLAKGTR